MTAATLFTPTTPEFDDISVDNINDKEVTTEPSLSSESAAFKKLQKKLRRQVSWAIGRLIY